jgi:hypothetical protein
MLKVIKRYIMPLKRLQTEQSRTETYFILVIIQRAYVRLGTLISGAETIFSSYPGTLHSVGSLMSSF